MSNPFVIHDSMENKISFYHLAFFLLLLPFDRIYAELILISFVLHTIFHLTKERARNILSRNNLILFSIFFIGVIGLLWSNDRPQGIKDLQRQSGLLLLPIALSATGLDLKRYKKNLLLLFGFSCSVVTLYLYIDAFRIILYNKMPLKTIFSPAFINHNFSEPIGIHATYMAMYIALSLAAYFYYTSIEKRYWAKWIYAVFIAIMLAGLVQLASRSVLIAMAVFALVFPFFLMDRQKKLRWILGVIGLSAVALVAITQIDAFQRRYVTTLKEDLLIESIHNKQPESRAYRWEQALQLSYASPLAGYGTGSEKRLLKERYFEKKLYRSYLLQLNAHNQYISFLLKTGIIGLLVFLTVLVMGFIAAWRSKDAVFSCFMLLIAIVSISENILDVNKGIFFYSFFFSFFLQAGKPFGKLSRLVKKKEQYRETLQKQTAHASVISSDHNIQ
jgi:O-antigen ligase